MNERNYLLLRALHRLAKDLRALCQQIHAIHEDDKAARACDEATPADPLVVKVSESLIPPSVTEHYEAENRKRKSKWRWLKTLVEAIGIASAFALAVLTYFTLQEIRQQTPSIQKSSDAAKSASDTAAKSLEVGNRPWVKITHRIIEPLTFGFIGAAGPAATMTVEDRLENVGPTVALHVLTWEDVIPQDYEDAPSHFRIPWSKSALARRDEWCGTNRNSEQSRTIGNILFPHSPVVQLTGMAALMSKVHAAMERSPVKGKVGFVMVGCVCYRSSFEDLKRSNHQTRFIYYLGIPQASGGWMPFITPNGIAHELRLIESFQTFAAD